MTIVTGKNTSIKAYDENNIISLAFPSLLTLPPEIVHILTIYLFHFLGVMFNIFYGIPSIHFHFHVLLD